jgi:2-keto-4-pentenoate hydratase/2-oxohepta-3-ene-1,7-dioic acid hydratase in catechol pathway
MTETRDAIAGLPFGRCRLEGDDHYCIFAGRTVRLLDRPAWDPEAEVVRTVALSNVSIVTPVQPTKVIAVGLNYQAHVEEVAEHTGVDAAGTDTDAPPEPILFMKPPSAVIGPGDEIVLPARSDRVDYEAELVLVVSCRCKDLTPETAAEAVAGYTCGNDVTARDLQQLDGQWTRAKSFDTFCPLGPWMVRDLPQPTAAVTTRINNEVVQRGAVGEMIVAPLDLLVFVSGIMTLEPGDVIMTGTPQGVGPIAAGQRVTVAVDGIGMLTNPVAAQI